jgi:predicted DsbA family dithiol-disulfide isomerase
MKRLIWWAEAKGQTIAGMWQNVVQARIEANDAQIQQMAEEIAEAKGLTVDEWKQRMLKKNNYEPNDGESIDDAGGN